MAYRIELDKSKSVQVIYRPRPIDRNLGNMLQFTSDKYLGVHLDVKLTWQPDIKVLRDQINIGVDSCIAFEAESIF